MQNKKLIILIILSIAAVISLIYGMTSQPKKRGAVSTQQPSAIKKEVSVANIEKIIPAEKRGAKRSDYVTWGRNPFAPVEASVRVVTKLTLNGIMWDEERPLAIINDNVVGIGGKVGENRVVDIKKGSVILNDGTSNFELRLVE